MEFILILEKDWDGWLRWLDRIFSKREFSFSERVSIHDLNTHPLTLDQFGSVLAQKQAAPGLICCLLHAN